MRYRDQPTVEAVQRLSCDPSTAWRYVSDITLPARVSTELIDVAWLDGADHVALGARFTGRNRNAAIGEWETVCEVVEFEPERRWVWNVVSPGGVIATWGFEVEPSAGGCLVRQWARMGPAPSGLTFAITSQPDKEARIVTRRLEEWLHNMQANLNHIAEQTGTSPQ